ncbi:MAG: hypothetical protein RLZZ505_1964 [Verrucomicrobiota bacterium]|jgi:hypothetical protein
MPTLRDNLPRWREAAQIDWFSHFIKAWIPFNAWMTETYGDESDRKMLDGIKAGSNVVFNRITPMITVKPRSARDTEAGWQNETEDAEEFRRWLAMLHRRLEECVVDGRKGRISFTIVDVGENRTTSETKTHRNQILKVERGVPAAGKITASVTTATTVKFQFVQDGYDKQELEDNPDFQKQVPEVRGHLLNLYRLAAPRIIESVLVPPSQRDCAQIDGIRFVDNQRKVFGALIEVLYGLRNALFHGSITPNDQHNEIYEPAYHLVMRMVKCTI